MIAKPRISCEYIKDISTWEKEYLKKNRSKLSERQIKILEGSELKSNEGMLFGQMYADWKLSYENE
tara:strand:- start:2015 stop:2212 length:198 start_codon:yes stop_codon:yes gene_type:complete